MRPHSHQLASVATRCLLMLIVGVLLVDVNTLEAFTITQSGSQSDTWSLKSWTPSASSRTSTRSKSSTPSCTVSKTSTQSGTVSKSGTVSESFSHSSTASKSGTQSGTVSESGTQSGTVSESGTQSSSVSKYHAVTRSTKSYTQTTTATGTKTPTMTITSTTTPTATLTVSVTPTISEDISETASVSRKSRTPSGNHSTRSTTHSPSGPMSFSHSIGTHSTVVSATRRTPSISVDVRSMSSTETFSQSWTAALSTASRSSSYSPSPSPTVSFTRFSPSSEVSQTRSGMTKSSSAAMMTATFSITKSTTASITSTRVFTKPPTPTASVDPTSSKATQSVSLPSSMTTTNSATSTVSTSVSVSHSTSAPTSVTHSMSSSVSYTISMTVTPTRTPPPTPSRTASPHVTLTSSSSSSVSRSAATSEPSASSTVRGLTRSMSSTPSESNHPHSASRSQSFSTSLTHDPSKTFTLTPSLSTTKMSASPNPTHSVSASRTQSTTRSSTYTLSSSATKGSFTMQSTVTKTRSQIPTPSRTLRLTYSQSLSKSTTVSRSRSVSTAPTSTISLSVSYTVSLSRSTTLSVSLTRSATFDITKSVVSATTSFSMSVTMSTTVTQTITPPPTPSRTVSLRATSTNSSTRSKTYSVSNDATLSKTVKGLTHSTSASVSVSAAERSATMTQTMSPTSTRSVSQTVSMSVSWSLSKFSVSQNPSYSVSTTLTQSASTSNTSFVSASTSPTQSLDRSASVSGSEAMTLSDTFFFTYSRIPSKSSTPSGSRSHSITYSTTFSDSLSRSNTRSRSVSYSVSIGTRSASRSSSATITVTTTTTSSHNVSTSDSVSTTMTTTSSDSSTMTPTKSLSISIDPCNTTFRRNSAAFIQSIQTDNRVLQFAPILPTQEYFLTINRVQFTLLGNIPLVVNFNTYLRNFYYEVLPQWFVEPSSKGCFVSNSRAINATSMGLTFNYDSTYVLGVSVHDDIICNVTFSTNIFQCQLMTNLTYNFSLVLRATSMDPLLPAEIVSAFSSVTSILSLFLGAATMLAQSRATSIMSLNDCQFSIVDEISFPDNVLGLHFGTLENSYERGTVIGNIVLVIGFAIVFAVGVTLRCCLGEYRAKQQEAASARTERGEGKDGDEEASEEMRVVSGLPPPEHDQKQDDIDFDPFEIGLPLSQPKPTGMKTTLDALLNLPPIRPIHAAAKAVGKTSAEVASSVLHGWNLWREYASRVRFPSLLLVPLSFVFDSVVASAASLVVHPRESYDLPLGIIALCICVVIIVAIGVKIHHRRFPLKLVRTRRRDAYPILRRFKVLLYCFYPVAHWSGKTGIHSVGRSTEEQREEDNIAKDNNNTAELHAVVPNNNNNKKNTVKQFKSSYHFIIDDLRFPQYTLMELTSSLVIGACVGVSINDRRVCLALSIICAVALFAQCAFLVLLRPILTRYNIFFTIAMNGLCLGSCVLVAIAMTAGSDALGYTPSVVAFVGSLLSLVKGVLDTFFFCMWIWYACCAKHLNNNTSEANDGGGDDGSSSGEETFDANTPRSMTPSSGNGSVVAENDDETQCVGAIELSTALNMDASGNTFFNDEDKSMVFIDGDGNDVDPLSWATGTEPSKSRTTPPLLFERNRDDDPFGDAEHEQQPAQWQAAHPLDNIMLDIDKAVQQHAHQLQQERAGQQQRGRGSSTAAAAAPTVSDNHIATTTTEPAVTTELTEDERRDLERYSALRNALHTGLSQGVQKTKTASSRRRGQSVAAPPTSKSAPWQTLDDLMSDEDLTSSFF